MNAIVRRAEWFLLGVVFATSIFFIASVGRDAARAEDPYRAEIPGAEIEYFPIEGRSWEEWRESTILTLELTGGPRALAWTTWGAEGSWACVDGVAHDLTVRVPIVVHLPRPPDLSEEELPEWRRYLSHLVQHEAVHVGIVLEHVGDYAGIEGSPCDEAQGKIDRIYEFISGLNRRFDEER